MIGERRSNRVVRDVVHALQVLIARMEGHPDEAKAFGFGAEILATLNDQTGVRYRMRAWRTPVQTVPP